MTLISIQKNIIFPTLKFAQVGVPRTLTKVLQTLLKILMCFLGFGVQYLIGIEIFVGIILFFLLFKFTRKYPIKIPDRKHIRQYIEFSVKVFSIGIISALLFNIDKVMIEHFIGIEILGIFFLAQRTASILNIIPKKIVNLFVPRFSKLFEEANFEEISRLCRLSIKYQSYVILAIIGVLVIVANNLFFLLYGSDSLESVPVFIVLLISVYVYSITMPFSSQFISTGHTGIAFGINLSVLITNIVFNLFLIPDQIYGYQTLNYGIIGAAYSTVISLSVKFILSYIYAYKLTKSKLYNRIWLHWLAFLFPLIFIVLNKDIMDNILAVIFSSLAFILVFFGTLYLFNEFGKKEIRVYLNISNPKLMKKYMIDELNE